MGNWRTVHLIGTCPHDELALLDNATFCDYMAEDMGHFGPLSWSPQPSICGLNRWPAEEIDTVGNLAERDYSIEHVAVELRRLVRFAPGLRLAVHCGDDYEENKCAATITVEDGEVTVGPPHIEHLPAPRAVDGQWAFVAALSGLRQTPRLLTSTEAERLRTATRPSV